MDEETVRGSVRAGAAWAEVFSLPLRGGWGGWGRGVRWIFRITGSISLGMIRGISTGRRMRGLGSTR